MDDFGTGFSSLSLLTRLPIDKLKIDRLLLWMAFPATGITKVLVSTIILMAHNLGFEVVAEGVETAEQRDFLTALGCDQVQGLFLQQTGIGGADYPHALKKAGRERRWPNRSERSSAGAGS